MSARRRRQKPSAAPVLARHDPMHERAEQRHGESDVAGEKSDTDTYRTMVVPSRAGRRQRLE
jgi:hypothetical protein